MGKTEQEMSEAGAERKQRLAAELRANLKRRKARARDTQASKAQVTKQPD